MIDEQERIRKYSEQEQSLTQEVEEAQAQQEAALELQQQEQERLRARDQEEDSQIAAQLAEVQNRLAQLQAEAEQIHALSDVSQSGEEDPEISSFDEDDSESGSDAGSPHAAGQQNAGGPARVAGPSGDPEGSTGRLASLTNMLQRIQPVNGKPPVMGDNLLYLLNYEQHVNTIIQVCFTTQQSLSCSFSITHVRQCCQPQSLFSHMLLFFHSHSHKSLCSCHHHHLRLPASLST